MKMGKNKMQKSMKRNTAVLLLIMSCVYTLEAQSWEKIEMNFPPTDTLLYNSKIAFATKDIGWIITTGPLDMNDPLSYYLTKIFKTVDGGHNWVVQKSLDSSFGASSIFTTDSLHCWAIGNDLLFTSDGGNTWNTFIIGDNNFYTTHFFNNKEGIALSLKKPWFTTDGGNSWTAGDSSLISLRTINNVVFADRNRGWFVSDFSPVATDGGAIANTVDGGKTWAFQDSNTAIMYGVDFVDTLTGFAVGTNGSWGTGFIYSTTDGGKQWSYTQDFTMGILFDVSFFNSKIGWIIGRSGRIWRTTDSGTNWVLQNLNTNATLGKIIVLQEAKTAYIWGGGIYDLGLLPEENPYILFYADLSNITKVKEQGKSSPEKYYLMQNYPNPFNPCTVISYQLPENSFVTLTVYDLLGREVEILANEKMNAGLHTVRWNATMSPSGVYIVKLTAGNFVASKKLMLLK